MNQVPKVINYFIIFEDQELLSSPAEPGLRPLDYTLKSSQVPTKKRVIKVEHDHTAQHQMTFDGMTKRNQKDYPPAKIPEHELPSFTHHSKHAVNQCIDKANQTMMCLFKQKFKLESEHIT